LTETRDLVERSLDRLEAHLVAERFRGYDPYDALCSPLFRLPLLRSAKWPRLAAQQALKRLPYDVRPLLGIRKSYDPVTLAFVLEASAYRAQVDTERAEVHRSRAVECVSELAGLRSSGWSGDCWGYPFDWEARYGRVPAGTPTIVATGIVANALFVAYRLLELENTIAMCESSSCVRLSETLQFHNRGCAFAQVS